MYLYVDSAQTSEPWCCFCIRASRCGVQCTEYCFSTIGRSKEIENGLCGPLRWCYGCSTLISDFSAFCFVFCLEKEGCLHSSAGGGKHKTFHQEAYAGKDRNTWIHAASDTGGLWPGQQKIRINVVQLLLAQCSQCLCSVLLSFSQLECCQKRQGDLGIKPPALLSHGLFLLPASRWYSYMLSYSSFPRP